MGMAQVCRGTPPITLSNPLFIGSDRLTCLDGRGVTLVERLQLMLGLFQLCNFLLMQYCTVL